MESKTEQVNDGIHSDAARAEAAEPRPKDAARTRADILRAAQKVFSTHGYTHAGLREIAAKAGINVALVGRYFGSKEKLFEAALDDLFTSRALWNHPRESFGREVVNQFVSSDDDEPHALPILTQAAADPIAQALAQALIRTRLIGPLAEWLGPPDAEARAGQILAITAGFFTYRMLVPLEPFAGPLDPSVFGWLEKGLQDIVDAHA
ncbi:MAG: TetR family transcriptional regulator [Caulobacteraceae bacterium]|nr:TetR family transcriptional regulator [Caulobacteraceae bacterium]